MKNENDLVLKKELMNCKIYKDFILSKKAICVKKKGHVVYEKKKNQKEDFCPGCLKDKYINCRFFLGRKKYQNNRHEIIFFDNKLNLFL